MVIRRYAKVAALKTQYDQRVGDYNHWLNQQQVSGLITGTNPEANRQVERTELKKHCIEFQTSAGSRIADPALEDRFNTTHTQ